MTQQFSSWHHEPATPQHGERWTLDYRIWFSPQNHKTYHVYWYYSDNNRRGWYYYWDPQGGYWWWRCRNWMHSDHDMGGRNWSRWQNNSWGSPGDPPVVDTNTGETAFVAPDPPLSGPNLASANRSLPSADPTV